MSSLADLSGVLLSIVLLVLLLGRLRIRKSKDRAADYIQECIADPDKDVYYRDGKIVIEHRPHSSNTKANGGEK